MQCAPHVLPRAGYRVKSGWPQLALANAQRSGCRARALRDGRRRRRVPLEAAFRHRHRQAGKLQLTLDVNVNVNVVDPTQYEAMLQARVKGLRAVQPLLTYW